MASFPSLSDEILHLIFRYMHPRHVMLLRALSRQISAALFTDSFATANLRAYVPYPDRTHTIMYAPNSHDRAWFQTPHVSQQRAYARAYLRHVREMYWGRNGVTGSIPRAMGALVHLVHLRLDLGRLVGVIPEEVGRLHMLESLVLRGNALEGQIPNALGELARLERLDLGQNRLKGEIPRSFCNLMRLRVLVLDWNELIGRLPDSLSFLPWLESLNVSNNGLTGMVPVALTRLKYLDIKNNYFFNSPAQRDYVMGFEGEFEDGMDVY